MIPDEKFDKAVYRNETADKSKNEEEKYHNEHEEIIIFEDQLLDKYHSMIKTDFEKYFIKLLEDFAFIK